MASTTSIAGSLDVQSLVAQVMHAERAPIRTLQRQEQTIQAQAAAYRDFRNRMLSLSSAASSLASLDVAAAKTAASTNNNVLRATASGKALAGSYSVTVHGLATTDTYASAAFSSETAAIPTGTFSLKVGSESAVTIAIDSSNSTLAGLRDAINASGAGAVASIVKDGSNFKLALVSRNSGAASAITLSDYSNPDQQAALNLARTGVLQDASLTVNGITLSNASNTFTDALQGVTFQLAGAGTAQVTVESDTLRISGAINDFILAYNEVNSFFNAQFRFNTASGTAGVLAGDGTLRRIQANLQDTLSGSISGLSTPLATLLDVGIQFANDGSLSLDTAKLNEAVASNPSAVSNLFLTSARFSDSRATLVTSSSVTQAGTYPLYLTRGASQAQVTGSAVVNPVSGLSADGTVTVTYGGTEHSILLTTGQTTSAVVNAVNAVLEGAGAAVRASDEGGRLRISTQQFGSSQAISVRASATISSDLGIGTSNQTGTGQDVAGTINGNTASGNGQTLLAATGGAEEGLAILANVSAASVGGGLSLGNATFTVGFAELVKRLVSTATSGADATIGTVLTSLESRTSSIRDSIRMIEDRLERRQQLLTDELIRANSALQEMNIQIQSLNSQLAALAQR